MKKFVLCFLFYLLFSTFYLPTVFAQDSSPSANIQSKLKALQEEIASRAANMKNEVSKKLLNKAYIGIIKSKDSTSLTVSLRTETGNININEFTEYVIKTKTLVGDTGLKSLNVSDSIAALGDIDDNGVLTAKKIVKLAKPVVLKKVIYGSLASVATSSAVLKTAHDDQFTINFDKNTDYQLSKSDGSFSDIKINQWTIVVTEETNPQPFLAKFVYIFPTTSSATKKP